MAVDIEAALGRFIQSHFQKPLTFMPDDEALDRLSEYNSGRVFIAVSRQAIWTGPYAPQEGTAKTRFYLTVRPEVNIRSYLIDGGIESFWRRIGGMVEPDEVNYHNFHQAELKTLLSADRFSKKVREKLPGMYPQLVLYHQNLSPDEATIQIEEAQELGLSPW